MKKKLSVLAASAGILALTLAGCASDTTEPTPSDDPTTGTEEPSNDPSELVLVLTPSDEVSVLEPAGEAIAAYLTDALGITVTSFVASDYAGVVTALGTGQADIAFTAPALSVQALDQGAGDPILQVTREGERSYVTQWFTNDPDTYCLTDVVSATDTSGEDFLFCNGVDTASYGDEVGYDALELITPDTVISFVSDGSTSGYRFPVTQLISFGVIDAPEDLTNAIFAGGSHPGSVLNVARGDAVIGTSYDDARAQAIAEDPAVGTDVVVFAWSTPIPNDGVTVASDLSDDLKSRIKAALEGAFSDEATATALYDAYEIDGFADADLEALDIVRLLEDTFR